VWIEKGRGLIVPGFIPSTLHVRVEYAPCVTEWKIMLGIWAAGAMVLTVALKVALPLIKGSASRLAAEPAGEADPLSHH
jgi:molybdopterin-containing oxidoreductase family membrane subunit